MLFNALLAEKLKAGLAAAAATSRAERAETALASVMVVLGKCVRVEPQIVVLKVWSSPSA
jgi:hypothetical protein